MERIRENLIKESLMNIRFLAQSEYFNGIHIKDDIILEKKNMNRDVLQIFQESDIIYIIWKRM